VRMLWTKWHWDRYFSDYFYVPLSVSFRQCSILIFTYTSLLPEGQIGQTGQTRGNFKNMPFGNRVTLDRGMLSCTLLVVKHIIKTRQTRLGALTSVPGGGEFCVFSSGPSYPAAGTQLTGVGYGQILWPIGDRYVIPRSSSPGVIPGRGGQYPDKLLGSARRLSIRY
jgi:hypothetical protein